MPKGRVCVVVRVTFVGRPSATPFAATVAFLAVGSSGTQLAQVALEAYGAPSSAPHPLAFTSHSWGATHSTVPCALNGLDQQVRQCVGG